MLTLGLSSLALRGASIQPKERIYSLLVTPEAPARMEELRRWLGALDAEADTHVLVSHDTDFIATGSLPAYAPLSAGASHKDWTLRSRTGHPS